MENLYKKTKDIMRKYNISANKSLGQNFLISEKVVNEIVESSKIDKEDLVIEIGPGLGTLTKYLLEKAGKVIGIELDKKMVEILQDRFKLYNNFEQNEVYLLDKKNKKYIKLEQADFNIQAEKLDFHWEGPIQNDYYYPYQLILLIHLCL